MPVAVKKNHIQYKPPNKQATEIKIILLRRELTQVHLAQILGVPLATLNATIYGRRHNKKLQRRIAQKLGVKVKEIFDGGRGNHGRG